MWSSLSYKSSGQVFSFVFNIVIKYLRFLGFRDAEEARLKADPKLTLGDVTTINLTIMEGGVQVRIV